MSFFKNSQKAMAAFMLATGMSMTFTACSDEMDDAIAEMDAPVENTFMGFGATADTYNYNDALDELQQHPSADAFVGDGPRVAQQPAHRPD